MSAKTLCAAAFLLLAASLSGNAEAAVECALMGGEGASISVQGQQVDLPAIVRDCEGGKVEGGKVVACVQDRRGRLSCQSFQAGEIIVIARLGPSGARDWLAGLMELLGGQASTQAAISRGSGVPLPTGPALFLDDMLEIDFSHVALRDVNSVEFQESGSDSPVLLSVPGIGVRSIDARRFEVGKTYVWTLLSTQPMPVTTGRFTVRGGTELRAARARQQQIAADRTMDLSARNVLLAQWLYQRNYRFDAETVLRQAGFLPK